MRTCRRRRWWRRVGEARGRRTPSPSPRRERMPFRRLPSAASGDRGHHAIAAGDGAAAIPELRRGRGASDRCAETKNSEVALPLVFISLSGLFLFSFGHAVCYVHSRVALRWSHAPFLCCTDGVVILKP